MTTVIVGTSDFRQALKSVAPHAFPKPDLPTLHRIRLEVDSVNLYASATNRYTAGLAIASVEDATYSGDSYAFDLSPKDVAEILALFRGSNPASNDDQPDDQLQIAVDDTHVTVTDVGGLFPGKSLRLPRYPQADDFPFVRGLVHGHLTARKTRADLTVVTGQLLGLFGAAAKAYGQPLAIEGGQRNALVISCGDSFLGLLMPHKLEPEQQAELRTWRDGWLYRLERANELTVVG